MFARVRSPMPVSRPGNLGYSERWFSLLAGAGLTLAALRGGGLLRRAALSAAGLSLLSRGAAGYCGIKSAVNGESSLPDGLREQWQRLRARLGRGAAGIDSMHALYTEELQEMHSSEVQLHALLQALEHVHEHEALRDRLRVYARSIDARARELERILSSSAADASEHPDQAMQALINETYKMAEVCAANVRAAALVASLQRLTHYRIAAYGSVVAFARSLGRTEEVALLARYLEHDKAFDAELTALAESIFNPKATARPQDTATGEVRPH
jgi:ferritin-like metal-binding protein YciE